MHYKNKISRFILRKDFLKRFKQRINSIKRKNNKNEISDIIDLFTYVGHQPKVIFDCGANIGFVTFKFFKAFKGSHIYSFEPNPLIFEKLNAFYKKFNKVTCVNKGIGSESGELIFNINRNSGTSSFLNPTDYHKMNIASHTITPLQVEVVKIDDYLNEHNIDHIDILKLDIEGFEIEALKGIKNLNKKVSLIFTEANLIPTYEGQPLIEDIISYCREHSFHLVNFYGINENSRHQATITNLLFMSNEFKNELIDKVGSKSFGY